MPVTRNAYNPGNFNAIASEPDLLRAIERFCVKHGINAAQFGRLAMNDPAFVYDLRAKLREPRKATKDRVRAFMEGYQG
jgi:hypothetical protein